MKYCSILHGHVCVMFNQMSSNMHLISSSEKQSKIYRLNHKCLLPHYAHTRTHKHIFVGRTLSQGQYKARSRSFLLAGYLKKYIEINSPLVKNTGNISRGSCKSGKQTSAHARVCLQDLQVPREIFLEFLTKGRLIYILHLHLQKCPLLPFMTFQSDVNDTLTLRHLFCFWRHLVRFNVRKDLSLRKLSLLSSSKITRNSNKIAMKM